MGLFDFLSSDAKKSYNWTATFEYMGEHWSVTIYGRENQPAEFEFLNELRKKMGARRYDSSKLRLREINKR